MILCSKVEQKLVSGIIGSFEDLGDMAEPEEIGWIRNPSSISQKDVVFEGKSRGKSTQKSDRTIFNLYLDPFRRNGEQGKPDADLKSQRQRSNRCL